MNKENKIGKTVIVYCRYLFAIPVKGIIRDIALIDGAYQVDFFRDQQGSENVTKHNGKYFHWQQCQIVDDEPNLKTASFEELLDELFSRWNHEEKK